MSDPTQADAQARSVVAVIVAIVVSFVCLLVLGGLVGSTYLWLKEKKLASEQAEDQTTRVAWLEAELDTLQQDQQRLRIENTSEQSKLRAELKTHQQAYGALKAGLFAFDPPRQSEPVRGELADYPQPTASGIWAGELKAEHGRPAEYTLPYEGPVPIRPYPKESYTSTRIPFAFSQDQSKFFIVAPQSVLRRFDSATLKEEMTLALGAACFDMAMTTGGLALSLPSRDTIWMIAPQTMSVVGEVRLKHANHLAATPTSEHVYAIGQTQAIGFDPETRQASRSIQFDQDGALSGAADRFNNRLTSFAMHPDGKHLFTAYGSPTGLHQFAITSSGIQYKTAVPIGRRRKVAPLFMSADGALLAMPGASTMHIFDANQPEIARLSLKGYATLSACTFDTTYGRVAASAMVQHRLHLNIYTTDGELESSFGMRGVGKEIVRLEAMPMGQRYLLWSNNGIWISDIQHDRIKAAIPEERHWSWEREKERRRLQKEAEERRRNPQF